MPRYSVVVSIIAVCVATSGSAFAAKRLTVDSRHIKNNEVAHQHIQNSTLTVADFSAATRKYLLSSEAQRGPQGKAGLTGDIGEKGDRQYTYAYRETGRLRSSGTQPPNEDRCDDTGLYQWPGDFDPDPANDPCMNWRQVTGTESGAADYEPLSSASLANQEVMKLQTSDANAGYVKFRVRSDFIITSNVTLWHKGTIHTRAECVIQTARAYSSATPSGYTNAGVPVTVSSSRDQEVFTIGLVGGSTADGSEVDPGQYAARVACRSLDRYPGGAFGTSQANDWVFVKGNLTVVSSKD